MSAPSGLDEASATASGHHTYWLPLVMLSETMLPWKAGWQAAQEVSRAAMAASTSADVIPANESEMPLPEAEGADPEESDTGPAAPSAERSEGPGIDAGPSVGEWQVAHVRPRLAMCSVTRSVSWHALQLEPGVTEGVTCTVS